MPRSKSIIILLFLISTITSKLLISTIISKPPSYSSRVALYLINRPVHKCLKSLNYYKKNTLKRISNQMLSVQNLYDLAIRDLNETSSHNLRLLDDNGYGLPQDEIESNCADCAALSNFSISKQTESDIMRKFISIDHPDTFRVIQAYSRNEDEWREEMCHLKENDGLSILKKMGKQSLNEREIEYIKVFCEYYLS